MAAEHRRHVISLLLFPTVIATLLLVVYVGLTLLSGVRAYVGGESLWSKGQKQAVQSLYRFAITRREADYQRYLDGLAVPMADRRARLELQRATPDVDYAVRSFIEGKNHPEDAPHLVLIFRYFGGVSYMRRAIDIWTEGDAKLDELDREAHRLYRLVTSVSVDSAAERDVLHHIDRVDHELTALEAEFSTTLGEGARWLRWVVLLVVGLAGAGLAWIGTAIWQRLLRQERAARANEARLREAQKLEAIGRLAGGIAHDFNNLLTVIGTNLDLALVELTPGPPVPDELLRARRGVDRAAQLTRQLLAFGKRQVGEPRPLRLDLVVADLQSLLRRLIGTDVTLVTALDPTVRPVEADVTQIGQVMLHLAANARDAMPTGGTLTIRTYGSMRGPSGVGARGPGAADGAAPLGWSVLEVADTGLGMDTATRAHLFEPFFSTKHQDPGAGLGLATVYGIVSQYGGHVDVESARDKGTTFRIYLPAREIRREPPPPTEPPAIATTRGTETILLVEDEDAIREPARWILRRNGYKVLEAANGEEALKRLGEWAGSVDLLLSDVVMPVMGGPALALELARRGFEVPVVFMSGYTNDPGALDEMLGRGSLFLQKPFSAAALVAAVRKALDAASLSGLPSPPGRLS